MSEELRPYGTDSTDPPAEPLTREEQYLSAIAGVTSSSDIPPKPLTRAEKYLNKIVENGGGGGGGGTSDYTDLSNKPQINSITLTGNKTTSDLGIDEVPDVGENDDGKVLKASYSGGVGTYSWQTGGGSGGTSDYTDLTNKPQINNVTLSGNKSLSDLGIAAASDIPTVPITEIQRNSSTITPVSGVVNISVPTTAADVSAISKIEKGASFGVATLDSSGKLTSSQLPSISEVPTVGSNDNGKVLTAVYSGGSGSYEWATADDRVYYCTCSTSASTAKKVVSTTQDFKLTTGCIIAVKFNNANTASSVQLNVNNTGDKTIAYAASNPYTGTDKVVTGYGASHLNYYIYNGTNWRWGGCTAPRVPDASSATPQPLGTAAAGSSTDYARADHVHAMPATATTSAAGLMSATDKSDITITNITSSFATAEAGYTISNISNVYKRGKHIFGTLVIKKDSGTIDTAETVIGTIASAYRTAVAYTCTCGFGTTEWNVKSAGSVYLSASLGTITATDYATTNSVCNININYCIS